MLGLGKYDFHFGLDPSLKKKKKKHTMSKEVSNNSCCKGIFIPTTQNTAFICIHLNLFVRLHRDCIYLNPLRLATVWPIYLCEARACNGLIIKKRKVLRNFNSVVYLLFRHISRKWDDDI